MLKPDFPTRFSSRAIYLSQILIILLVGLAAYSNSLSGDFHFDDAGITDKALLWPRAFSPSARQFADLTFVLNQLLNGTEPFGYHLVNMVVHLAAAVALYGLAASALATLRGFAAPPSAGADTDGPRFLELFLPFSTALLFVSHPVQTQAVTYVVQRYTSMAALFYFCSVMAFIRARSSATTGQGRRRTVLYLAAALLCALLAMRSKEIAFTLPLMLLVVEVFLFQGRLLKNRYFVGGMLLTLLAIPLLRIGMMNWSGGLDDLLFNIDHGTKEELTYSRGDYFLTQIRVVVTYLRLLFFPVGLNLDHDIPMQRTLLAGPVLASLTLHLCLLATAVFLFVRSRRLMSGAGSSAGICLRLASLGIVWFYVALLIESSIIPILDVMFEHRLYLPSGGGILAVVATAAALAGQDANRRRLLWGGVALVCCVFTVATIQRNRVWNDDLRLWEDTARKSPDKPRVLANLTAAYLNANMPEKALPLMVRSLEMAPGMRDALVNLGFAVEVTGKYEGRYDNGLKYMEGPRRVKMRYYIPWFANTRNNLGLVYDYVGRKDDALRCFMSAVKLLPTFELAWYNLYLAAAGRNDAELAATALDRLQGLNPELARTARTRAAGVP